MTEPHPDWYPDPESTGLLRWWDGSRWTRQTRPASPRDAGPASAFGSAPSATSARPAGPAAVPPPGADAAGPQLPPVGQLAQPEFVTAEALRSPRRTWLLGGGIGVVVLAAAAIAALYLTGALSRPGPTPQRSAASPAPTPAALGAKVVDHRAGISFRIPAGPGWQRIRRAALGPWTLGYRKPAPPAAKGAGKGTAKGAGKGAGTGTAGGARAAWAELESAPLPSSYRYTGPQDLRSDGVQLADELAATHYPAPHTVVHLGVTRHGADEHGAGGRGDTRYVVAFRIDYPAAQPAGTAATRVTSETAAVVIAGRGAKLRPGVVFITVPDTMDVSLVRRIAASVAQAR